MLHSHSLVFSDFETQWYKRWAKELKQNKNNLEGHSLKANKFWQNAVIAQVLSERDLLGEGKKGIGFGVGQERLPALFASKGVIVTATDQDYSQDKAKLWQEKELAKGLNSLNNLKICDPAKFKKLVSFEATDMNNVPRKYFRRYDFAWSNCALGHLGTLDLGLNFIVKSANCLKPGGYAVHTTEVNVLSNDKTATNGDVAIFRPKDIISLHSKLALLGFELDMLQLDFGKTSADNRISMYPQFGNDYSKIQYGGHLLTQVVLIVKKPAKKLSVKHLYPSARAAIRKIHASNLQAQINFEKQNPFIKSIRNYEKANLKLGGIVPVKKQFSVSLSPAKEKDVFIAYKNRTGHPLFGSYANLYTTPPINLATTNPHDRDSKFKASDWFNNQANRPSIHLFVKGKGNTWERADHVPVGAVFSYRTKLNAKGIKKGSYQEDFMIVQEGKTHLEGTEVHLNIKVS